jgi:uncharacterized protein YabN with tetrapyrrole methylase and pyrophosphatase domain
MAAAEEEGRFSLLDVLEATHVKMIRRHGHIFGEHEADTPEDAMAVWERIKHEEREQKQARKAGKDEERG